MTNQITSSFVRIFSPGGEIAGAGFFIPERRVITYADVIAKVLGAPIDESEIPDGDVSLDFPLLAPGEKRKAKVIFWQPGTPGDTDAQGVGGNIAVLEMQSPPPEGPTYAPIPVPSDEHYWNVIDSIAAGRVVSFLGAGASLYGRPAEFIFRRGSEYLPSGGELAEHLARSFRYVPNDLQDLLRISQYVALKFGSGPLYETLRELFLAQYKVTGLHEFFAKLPSILRAKQSPKPYQLIVTTNYDDLLERAFENEQLKEPYDLISYVADGQSKGKFLHRRYNGSQTAPSPSAEGTMPADYMSDGVVRVIEKPNEDLLLSLEKRSVILKIHGAVDRIDADRDSFVITEDHYIDYLTRTDLSGLLPATLAAKLRRSHFLFLGYSLRDWNLRVILYRIFGERKLGFKSWSIQLKPDNLDKQFWEGRGVEILDANLEDYIAQLEQRMTT